MCDDILDLTQERRLKAKDKLIAELLEALKRARDELVDPNRGPSGNEPTLVFVEEAIRKAKEKDDG